MKSLKDDPEPIPTTLSSSPDPPADEASNGKPFSHIRQTIRRLHRKHTSHNGNGLGSRLTEDNVSEEALASSASILTRTRYGQKGLQQFFTPPVVADFIAQLIGTDAMVFDPTAGSGNLLAPYPDDRRFGIEVSPLYAKRPSYRCVTGDFQHVYPLLRRCDVTFPVVLLNPPFGLQWTIPSLNNSKSDDSTTLCLDACIELLDWHGVGVLIAGKSRFYREVCARHTDRFFAVIEVPDLFDDTRLDSVIAFFRKDSANGDRLTVTSHRTELNSVTDQLRQQFRAQGYLRLTSSEPEIEERAGLWKVIAQAHRRRLQARLNGHDGNKGRYDLGLHRNRLQLSLSTGATLALHHSGDLPWIDKLHRQSAHYFALNTREWRQTLDLSREGWVTVDPALRDRVESILVDAEFQRIPLYPLKPQKRLGFLPDVEQIRCVKDDPERDYHAGEVYSVSTRSDVEQAHETRQVTTKDGSVEERKFLVERKVLRATIGAHTFSESTDDIRYLLEHFDLPDPGDLGSRYSDLLQQYRELLQAIEVANGFGLKTFQREDLARLLLKGGGGLCWEMGLGKSLAAMVFHTASVALGAVKDQLLLIVPQDLIPQWQREAQKFFGRQFEVIDSHVKASAVAKRVRAGGTGWFLTYYEALSRNGRVHETLPHVVLAQSENDDGERLHTSAEFCPVCIADADEGWNGEVCRAQRDPLLPAASPEIYWWLNGRQRRFRSLRPVDLEARLEIHRDTKARPGQKCGYIHRRRLVKPVASLLSTTFRQGTIVVDEAVKIQGDTSLMSLAVRGLRAKRRLILSGEPIKNYLHQLYWLLWFALGNNRPSFPFDYSTGKTKFVNDFCVVEYTLDRWGRKDGRRRVKPEITNVSLLWRLLDTNIISRRMEETGEPLVPLTYHPIRVKFGTKQKQAYENWLDGFAEWFESTHPDHSLCGKTQLIDLMSALLGQYAKLQIASVLPDSQPDGWWTSPNMTPKNFAALRKVCELAQQGHKTIVFSSRLEFGKWFAERLHEKRVEAIHIVEGKDGKWTTKGPSKRASLVRDFIHGSCQVLCAGIEAMNLGHNLDVASKVVVVGLPWGMDTLRQAMARVRRLTSKQPVDAFIYLTEGSIDLRIYDLIAQKKAAAHLALHGELLDEAVEEVTQQQFLNQLRAWGVPAQETVDEADLLDAWNQWHPTWHHGLN